jgi:hypothetical protein
MRFEVFAVILLRIEDVWDVVLCKVCAFQRFGGTDFLSSLSRAKPSNNAASHPTKAEASTVQPRGA